MLHLLHPARNHSNLSSLCVFFINKTSSPTSHVTIEHCVSNVKNISFLEVQITFGVCGTVKQSPKKTRSKEKLFLQAGILFGSHEL